MTSTAKAAVPIVQKFISSQRIGVVVSAGKMSRAVKVRVAEQEWNKQFRKHFPAPKTYLVRDPNNSLVEGDVVRITSGHRTSPAVRHVVTSIVAPFGAPVEERPPVLSQTQLDAQRVQERLLKDVRAAARGRQASAQRLAVARKQGLEIPSLEEAERRGKAFDEAERVRRESEGKAGRREKHRGQSGQAIAGKQRRVKDGVKTKEEKKAEDVAKDARKQTV